MKHRVRPLALLALIASGCGVPSLLDKIDAESEKSVDIVCSCSNVFPDRGMCEAMFFSPFSFFDRDCLEEALETDKESSKATLKCILDNAREYNKCLEDRLDCNDAQSFSGCEPNFTDDCPELPPAVEEQASACGATTD
ncbi:hypothetical protein [Nannocystis radixulma]|uniref:Lipoprotein n=1 Tax=Nannocystis radixulma TaxID=2995305 RepID=A0ABT5BM95_9BACT|nr:hypothetical protein [Nannocystis radixulma]MDC0675285.1 hypothetical protein [Nannocystis radixulma]